MSNEVDKRVVQMEFDNKRFEKNVKTTKKSLDELNQSLQMKDADKGLEKVRVSFSALEVAAATAIANISNKIINLGERLIKSLSVDNIFSGWQKYGDKTVSVATLLAQKIKVAGKEIDDETKKLEAVNEQLDLLNWFSDETSYSFNDMVSNVGKFTAAGQDLDTSVKAMQGIATWAALSGQNATKASQAMYQLAQALGAGSVKLMDWKSIQNYNMDTEEFRATILDTAVAMGELTKTGDEFVTKTGKKFTQAQFTSFLSEGWFTSDVLIKGLNKYSAAVDQIYEISIKEGITASEVIEEYGDQLDAFGLKAFKAAQEARTFADVISSVKDAVSSKWMSSFEMLFGGQSGAVTFWTDLANALYDSFAAAGDFRNEVLSVWSEMEGYKDLFAKGGSNQGAFWNIYDAIEAVKASIKSAWNQVFPISAMQEYNDIAADAGRTLKTVTERIREFTASLQLSGENSRRITGVFKILFSMLKVGLNVLKAIRFVIDPIIEVGKQLIAQVLDKFVYYGSRVLDITQVIENVARKMQQIVLNLLEILDLPTRLDNLFNFLEDLFTLIRNYEPMAKITKLFKNFFESFRKYGGTTENLKKALTGLMSMFGVLAKVAIAAVTSILQIAGPLFELLGESLGELVGFIIGTITDLAAKIGDVFASLNDRLNGSGLSDFGEKLKSFLQSIIGLFKSLLPLIKLIGNAIKRLIDIILEIPKILDDISFRLTGKGLLDNLTSVFNTISSVFTSFGQTREQVANQVDKASKKQRKNAAVSNDDSGSSMAEEMLSPFQIFIQGMRDFVDGAGQLLLAAISLVGKALTILGGIMKTVGTFIIEVTSGQKKLETWQKVLIGIGAGILIFTALLAKIFSSITNFIWQLESTFLPLNVMADSISGYFDGKRYEAIGRTIEEVANAILKISVALLLLIEAGSKLSNSTKAVIAMIAIVGTLAAVIYLLSKQAKTLAEEATAFKELGLSIRDSLSNGIKGVADAASSAIDNFKQATNLWALADVIRQFGNLLIKIAVAFMLFEKISPEGIKRGMQITMLIMLGLLAISAVANKQGSEINFRKMMPSLFQMLGFAAVLKTVASTIISLSQVADQGRMWSATWAIIAVMAVVGGLLAAAMVFSQKLSNDKDEMKRANKEVKMMLKQMKGIIGSMAALVLSFALATKIMSSIQDPDKFEEYAQTLFRLIGAIGAMTMALTLLGKLDVKGLSGNTNGDAFAGLGKTIAAISLLMLSFATSLAIIGSSKDLTSEKIVEFRNVLFALMGVVTGVSTVLLLVSKIKGTSDNLDNLAKVFRSFAFNLIILSASMKILGSVSWGEFAKSAAIIGLALSSIAILMTIALGMNKVSGDTTIKKVVQSMLITLASLAAFALMMKHVTSVVDWEQIGKGALIMATAIGSLYALIGAAAVLKSAKIDATNLLSLSASLIVLSAALVAFSGALYTLSLLGWQNILVGMIGVAGALLTLFLVTKMTAPAIGAMTTLAATLALIGVALLMAGIGLKAMVEAIQSISAGSEQAMVTIVNVVTTIATALIDTLLSSIGTVAQSITENVPLLAEMLKTLILSALDLITDVGGSIISTVVGLITDVLTELGNNAEPIAKALGNIITSCLKEFDNRFDEISDSIWSIFQKLVAKIKTWIDPIVKDLVDIIIELLKSLKNNLVPKIPTILGLIVDIIGGILAGLVKVIIPLAGLLTKVLLVLLGAALELLITSLGALGKLFLTLVSSIILIVTHTFIGLATVIKESLKTIFWNVIKFANEVLQNLGTQLAKGLKSGFKSLISGIFSAIAELVRDIPVVGMLAGPLDKAAEEMKKGANSIMDEFADVIKGDNVMKAADEAGKNISNVISWSSKSIGNTLTDSFGQINTSVDKSLKSMDGAMTDMSNQMGLNFGEGFSQGILGSKDTVEEGSDEIGKTAVDTLKKELKIESPSRVMMGIGKFVSEGLAVGIQNGSSAVENTMADMLDTTLGIANDIINDENKEDLTLKVGLDISGVESQSAKIQDIMSGIDNPAMSYYGRNAGHNAAALSKIGDNAGIVNNDKSTNVNYNNTFNITSTDPQQSAEEIDKVLQNQALRAKMAHGS